MTSTLKGVLSKMTGQLGGRKSLSVDPKNMFSARNKRPVVLGRDIPITLQKTRHFKPTGTDTGN